MNTITSAPKLPLLLILLFACLGATGQNTGYFAFIPNSAGEIDKDGFQIGYHAIYSQWDLNQDGDITESEFYEVVFQRLDVNGDNHLSQSEWAKGEKYLFSNSDLSFKNLDTDKDKNLSFEEFEYGVSKDEFFSRFDSNQNGKLNRKELNDRVYKDMDLNNNGRIEKREFEAVNSLYINQD